MVIPLLCRAPSLSRRGEARSLRLGVRTSSRTDHEVSVGSEPPSGPAGEGLRVRVYGSNSVAQTNGAFNSDSADFSVSCQILSSKHL